MIHEHISQTPRKGTNPDPSGFILNVDLFLLYLNEFHRTSPVLVIMLTHPPTNAFAPVELGVEV